MMSRKFIQLSIFLGAQLLISSVLAVDTYVSGFATASVSCFSSDNADYVLNDQPLGPGRSKSCDSGMDSILGLQLDIGVNEKLDFGFQLIADRNQDRSYDPEFSLAQLRWQPDENLTLRLGRLLTPNFLFSESRQVRFSMPWVRPPLEVYGLASFFSVDGAEIISQGMLGRWQTEWHAGLTHFDIQGAVSNSDNTYPISGDNAYLNLLLREGNTQIKIGLGYLQGVKAPHPDLILLLDALRTFGGTSGAQLADDLAINDSSGYQVALAVQHEQADWLVISELAYRTFDGFFRDQYGAYFTVGHHIGKWLPYATVAMRTTSGPDSDSRAADPFQAGVSDLLAATRFDTSSLAVGLSYELHELAMIKFQVDWTQPDNNSWGLYTNHAEDYDFATPDLERLVTLSLDFVF